MIVRRIRSTLQYLVGRSRSRRSARDEALARYLFHTFEEELAPSELHGFHLYVRDGVVTICGTVESDTDRRLITSRLREEAGVTRVVDHMEVVDTEMLESQSAVVDCEAGSD